MASLVVPSSMLAVIVKSSLSVPQSSVTSGIFNVMLDEHSPAFTFSITSDSQDIIGGSSVIITVCDTEDILQAGIPALSVTVSSAVYVPAEGKLNVVFMSVLTPMTVFVLSLNSHE